MASSKIPNLRNVLHQDQNKVAYNGVVTRKRAALKAVVNIHGSNLNKEAKNIIPKLSKIREKENKLGLSPSNTYCETEEVKVDEIQVLINEPIKWPKCADFENKDFRSSIYVTLKDRREKIRNYYSNIIDSEIPIWFTTTNHDEFMHSEYLPSIIDYLMDKEEFYEPLGLDYLDQSSDINYRHRYSLVDWMVKIHQQLRFSNESLQLSIAIMDRFVKALKLQLKRVDVLIVGAMCLFIACKIEEVYTLTLSEFMEEINVNYDHEKCRMLEEKIVSTIEFKISIPVPLAFIRHYNLMYKADTISHLYSRYFCELSLHDYLASGYSSNMIGASSVLLAQIICQGKRDNFSEVWSPALQCSSGLLFTDISDLLRNLCIIVSKQQIASKYRAIAVKYSSDSYSKVAEKVIKSVGFISLLQYLQSQAKII